MATVLHEIDCKFNILDSGRQFTGQKRNYILDNVRRVLDSNQVQESLKLREIVGYFGHGVRKFIGLDPEEKSLVKVGGAVGVFDAVPSNVTTTLELDSMGNLRHIQQILDNDEGKKALGMHNSKVGGFSWACGGGKKGMNTILDSFKGFDYVRNPLFAENRGYILDDADGEQDKLILDSLMAAGLNSDDSAATLLQFQGQAIEEAEAYKSELEAAAFGQAVLDGVEREFASARDELTQKVEAIAVLESAIEKEKGLRQQILDSVENTLGVGGLDQETKDLILDGCPTAMAGLFVTIQKAGVKRAKFEADAPEVILDDANGKAPVASSPALFNKRTNMRSNQFS